MRDVGAIARHADLNALLGDSAGTVAEILKRVIANNDEGIANDPAAGR